MARLGAILKRNNAGYAEDQTPNFRVVQPAAFASAQACLNNTDIKPLTTAVPDYFRNQPVRSLLRTFHFKSALSLLHCASWLQSVLTWHFTIESNLLQTAADTNASSCKLQYEHKI